MAHYLETPDAAIAWELRGAWATTREVALALRGGQRLRGVVEHVAASDAFALVWDGRDQVHVPVAVVRSVRRPHFHEDDPGLAVLPRGAPRALVLPPPGQMTLFGTELHHDGQLGMGLG